MNGIPAGLRFRDAHTHLAAGAADLLDLDVRALRSRQQLAAALIRTARATAPGSWIRGFGWDGAQAPDDAAPLHPVFLARGDGHAAWVNPAGRAALGLAPEVSVIDETSFDAVRRKLPARSTSERLRALRPHLAELSALRLAAVDDMVEPWAPEVYARLRDAGELPVAVGLWLPEEIDRDEADALRREFQPGDPALAVRGIKIFLDGTLGARTAALSSPYADRPETSGTLRMPERELRERIMRWADRGWPVAIHAIGDRAVSLALSSLERANPPHFGRHRIEHAQVVLESDLPRFARAGIMASLQPGHWRDDRGFLGSRLGERPGVVTHPLASFARAGATIVFGSDWPVSSYDPSAVLAAASDPERGEEACDAADASAWYTSAPR